MPDTSPVIRARWDRFRGKAEGGARVVTDQPFRTIIEPFVVTLRY